MNGLQSKILVGLLIGFLGTILIGTVVMVLSMGFMMAHQVYETIFLR